MFACPARSLPWAFSHPSESATGEVTVLGNRAPSEATAREIAVPVIHTAHEVALPGSHTLARLHVDAVAGPEKKG